MPKGILSILASDITVAGASDFTANNAVNDLAVNNVGGNTLAMFDAGGFSKFALGDNILIRKIWCVIPWGFGAGGIASTTFLHTVKFQYWDGATLFDIGPLVHGPVIPTLCDPVDFGDGLFDAMATAGGLRQIVVSDIRLRVSQLNLPAALNGVRIPVQYYMEVLHTKGLSV